MKDSPNDVKLVLEEDETVNFDLVEPAKNYKPWTPKFLLVLGPLNNGKSSRSASGINGYDDDLDLCTIDEVAKETGDSKDAIMYAIRSAGKELTPSSRFSVDEVLEYLDRVGRPYGWVPSPEFARITYASKTLLEELREKEEHIKPVLVGNTYYYDPDWEMYVVAYRIRRADEKAAERLAARKAYKPTSNGPLRHVKYSHGPRPGCVPPRPTWLTQAESEGLLTAGKLAEYLDVSSDTIRHWSDSGYITPAKIVPNKNNTGSVRLYKPIDCDEAARILSDIRDGKKARSRERIERMRANGTLCQKGDKSATKAANEAYVASIKKAREARSAAGEYNLTELSDYLGYSEGYMRRQLKEGKIKSRKSGRSLIVTKASADAWRKAHLDNLSERWKSKAAGAQGKA